MINDCSEAALDAGLGARAVLRFWCPRHALATPTQNGSTEPHACLCPFGVITSSCCTTPSAVLRQTAVVWTGRGRMKTAKAGAGDGHQAGPQGVVDPSPTRATSLTCFAFAAIGARVAAASRFVGRSSTLVCVAAVFAAS